MSEDGINAPGAQIHGLPSIHHHNHIYHGPINHFGQAQNVSARINYGLINQSSTHFVPQASVFTGTLPPSLHPIPNASHSRDRRRSPPNSRCLPGTRLQVLANLMAWAMGEGFDSSLQDTESGAQATACGGGQHLVWLRGPAGSGKSAISQTICEALGQQGVLLGSFFFFRGSGDRSSMARFVVTLACQMVETIPETLPLVSAVLRSHSLQGEGVNTQFHRLILGPLQAVGTFQQGVGYDRESGLGPRSKTESAFVQPFVIVVDGLDECDDKEDVAEWIVFLLDFFDHHPTIPLRLLIVSRTEAHIQGRLDRDRVHIEDLHLYSAHADIVAVVAHAFQEAVKHDRIIRSFGKEWPSSINVAKLIAHANGSFIFIRTLLDYIIGPESTVKGGQTPIERFELALNMNGLDGIYTDILKRSQNIPHFCDVVLVSQLDLQIGGRYTPRPSICDVALLLDIPTYKVVSVLTPLQSIIYVPEDDETPIASFHTALSDFIRDERRSCDLFPSSRQFWRDRVSYRVLELWYLGSPSGRVPSCVQLGDVEKKEWELLGAGDLDEQRAKRHAHFFIHLGLRMMTRRELELNLSCFFSGSYRCPISDPPGRRLLSARSFDRSGDALNDTSRLFHLSLFEGLEILTNFDGDRSRILLAPIVQEMGGLLRSHHFPPTDAATHRCVVMHATLFFMNSCTMKEPDMRLALHWTRHLALAISPTNDSLFDTDMVSTFLHSLYVPARHSSSYTVGSWCGLSSDVLNRNIQFAMDIMEERFPRLLEVLGAREIAPDHHMIYKWNGFSLIDMLNAFRHLLLKRSPDPKREILTQRVTLVCFRENVSLEFLVWYKSQWRPLDPPSNTVILQIRRHSLGPACLQT